MLLPPGLAAVQRRRHIALGERADDQEVQKQKFRRLGRGYLAASTRMNAAPWNPSMSSAALTELNKIEASLWQAADQ